jgi:hypothetical protein
MDVKTTFRNLVRDQSVSICMLQNKACPGHEQAHEECPGAPLSTETYSFSLCEYAGSQNLISNYQIINAWGRLGPRILGSHVQSNNLIYFTCILSKKSQKNNNNQKYTLFTISKHINRDNICYKRVALLQSQT